MWWTFVGEVLKPIKTDMQSWPAPESRLKFVSCKFISTSKNVFCKSLFPWRKHGLKYMVACGACRGQSYGNSVGITEELCWRFVWEKPVWFIKLTFNDSICWLRLWILVLTAGIYLFKVCSKNTKSRSENCSKLTIETQEHPFWCLSC